MTQDVPPTVAIEQIAMVCHEALRAYCETQGDYSQMEWKSAPSWQRNAARDGVAYALAHPDATPQTQHEAWLRKKIEDGWVYGSVKDPGARTHPCMVPYEQLPVAQRAKDVLFLAIVQALRGVYGL